MFGGVGFGMAWWLFTVPRPFVRPGHPHPGPLPPSGRGGIVVDGGFGWCLGRWFWDGVVVGCHAPPVCPPRSPSPWPSPAERERGFPFLPSRPSLGSRFRGMGLSGGFCLGSLCFCEGALGRFETFPYIRGAWAVHERPLRGAGHERSIRDSMPPCEVASLSSRPPFSPLGSEKREGRMGTCPLSPRKVTVVVALPSVDVVAESSDAGTRPGYR